MPEKGFMQSVLSYMGRLSQADNAFSPGRGRMAPCGSPPSSKIRALNYAKLPLPSAAVIAAGSTGLVWGLPISSMIVQLLAVAAVQDLHPLREEVWRYLRRPLDHSVCVMIWRRRCGGQASDYTHITGPEMPDIWCVGSKR